MTECSFSNQNPTYLGIHSLLDSFSGTGPSPSRGSSSFLGIAFTTTELGGRLRLTPQIPLVRPALCAVH